MTIVCISHKYLTCSVFAAKQLRWRRSVCSSGDYVTVVSTASLTQVLTLGSKLVI